MAKDKTTKTRISISAEVMQLLTDEEDHYECLTCGSWQEVPAGWKPLWCMECNGLTFRNVDTNTIHRV